MSLELGQYFSNPNIAPLPLKNPEPIKPEDNLKFSLYQLNYWLEHTPEYATYQKLRKDEAGKRVSISDLEKIIIYLYNKMGCDIEVPPAYELGISPASVQGTALHEARVLAGLVGQRIKPDNVKKILPSSSDRRNVPYQRALLNHQIPLGASLEKAQSVALSAWESFYNDPDLIEIGDLKDWRYEQRLRTAPSTLDLGRKLVSHYIAKNYKEEGFGPNDYYEYYEALGAENLKCGVTFSGRFDSIQVYEVNGAIRVASTDLKTGKMPSTPQDLLVHNWQALVMTQFIEAFATKYLKTGFMKRKNGCYLLYDLNHYFQVKGFVDLYYDWFDKRTGVVTQEKFEIENRKEADEQIAWLAKAIRVFKPQLTQYLKTGSDVIDSPKPSKKIPPDGLQQKAIDFDARPEVTPEEQNEFEEVAKELENIRPGSTFIVGFFGETGEECAHCGGAVSNYNKLIGGKGTGMVRKVVQEEKCTGCGKVAKRYAPKPVSKYDTILEP
ncbi:MAG TPA: hypothetical protein VF185_00585 [Patescibacteria group bacterium]